MLSTTNIHSRFSRRALPALLAICGACSESSEVGGRDAGSSETPAQADYSDQELEHLAAADDVQAQREPFHNAPPPDRSLHVTMSDGVRIAVDLYFPLGFDELSHKAPSAYIETWYTRGGEAPGEALDLYRGAGFVIAIADPRGFGASFGSQAGYITPESRNDQRDMIAWLASQSWSDGNVAAVGISVSAMQAEAALASGAPSLKAGIVRATEFDQYTGNLFPGGIRNGRIHGLVAEVLASQRGAACLADAAACPESQLGPVMGDDDFALLRRALQDHQRNIAPDALAMTEYADDSIGTTAFRDVSPAGHIDELGKYAVPTRLSASWTDGTTASGALARYNALPDVPMQVSIAATTHLGGLATDPFMHEPFQPAQVAPERQFGDDIEFLKHMFAGERIERSIQYYVLGAGTWKTTEVWPPRDVHPQTLQLSAAGLQVDAGAAGERSYAVDANASSGSGRNRWSSQQNSLVYYGDMRFAPGERATFDGAAIAQDSELVGDPELCLVMRSDQTDGTLFAYLEDVAPDGRVTYLTEGVLRLLHRKTASGGCDPARGTKRSFARADASPVVPGELMDLELPFLPVAAKIAKGHRIRLAIAGADAGTFQPLRDASGTWSIAYGGAKGSWLSLPLKSWKSE
jgi:uncharacterized protein